MKFEKIVDQILNKKKEVRAERSLLVCISGIDGSGKGFVTAKLSEAVKNKELNVISINIDGWLNLPDVRFDLSNPAGNFYENAIRFEEMFEKLIMPLKATRSVNLSADYAEETATEYRSHKYIYENIDIILLEGIFLFKKDFRAFFDLKIWIECSFDTSLKRAIERSQEGLPPEETVRAYETLYFPAQKIHFAKDNPQIHSDLIYINE